MQGIEWTFLAGITTAPLAVISQEIIYKSIPGDGLVDWESALAIDLNCDGIIHYDGITAGSTVYGTFKVLNIGGPNSTLNWEIESYPNWGTWTFNPISGENLTPEDEFITVYLTIEIPSESDTAFEGYIRVINQDDVEDYDLIPVYIKTPRQKITDMIFFKFLKNNLNIYWFLQLILKNF